MLPFIQVQVQPIQTACSPTCLSNLASQVRVHVIDGAAMRSSASPTDTEARPLTKETELNKSNSKKNWSQTLFACMQANCQLTARNVNIAKNSC